MTKRTPICPNRICPGLKSFIASDFFLEGREGGKGQFLEMGIVDVDMSNVL